VFHERRRVERELARAQLQGVAVNVKQLEAHAAAVAEMFISSLAGETLVPPRELLI